jgi:thiosulfate/3-mercaptopyruvate sulfurtransferase
VLDGQWALWESLKLPIERIPAEAAEPSDFIPRLKPEVRVDLGAMQDLAHVAGLSRSAVTILDARSEEEFSGQQRGQGILRPGHIPGAVNLCWRESILSEATPLYLSDGQLYRLFERAGARLDRLMIVYCPSGIEASQLYLLARALGYPVRLYDGSCDEWSRTQGAPVQGLRADR